MKKHIYILLLLLLIVSCQKEKDLPVIVPIPTITSIYPATGGYNILLTINGSNFSTIPSEDIVTIGGERVDVKSCTSTTIIIRVPALKQGDIPIVVSTKSGKAEGFSFAYTYTIYVAGYETLNVSGVHIAKYWVNGKETLLPNNPGNLNDTKAYSIFVSDTDVYVAGTNFNAVYWKNDTLVTLADTYSTAYSIFVKGKDVYVAGEELEQVPVFNFMAKYWKNGVATNLTNYYADSSAKSIYVTDNGDVYIAGQEVDGNPAAIYWKNGVITKLTDGSIPATANAICANGNDVYVGGNIYTQAVYWKNNVPIYITDGSYDAQVNAICVVDNKVYLAGSQRNSNGYYLARIWVYDCATNTRDYLADYSDGGSDAGLESIAVAGSSVYFTGFQNTKYSYAIPEWWTNGTTVCLANGNQSEYANSIYVK